MYILAYLPGSHHCNIAHTGTQMRRSPYEEAHKRQLEQN